jgi:hypothetical protein
MPPAPPPVDVSVVNPVPDIVEFDPFEDVLGVLVPPAPTVIV